MRNISISDKAIYFLIIIFAGLLFIPFLGNVHLFDWDEINFAESAREMISSGDYFVVRINFEPFWEKPPLFIWMQVLSMKVFGINEFAARFPNAVCGIITLLLIFKIGKKLISRHFGLLWVILYAGSVLPFFYFKSGIIDPWFNLFIFLAIYKYFRFATDADKQKTNIALSAAFIGLAILTKGPVALLIYFLTIALYSILSKKKVSYTIKNISLFAVVAALSGGLWFIFLIITGHFQIVLDFIVYQARLFNTHDAGHQGFLFYHFVVLFFGVFPASVIALPELFRKKYNTEEIDRYAFLLKVLFWVVLILFTIVKTKIVHYSSMCFFPLTFMAALTLIKIYSREYKAKKYLIWLTATLAVLYISITTFLPFFDLIKGNLSGLLKNSDAFTLGCINADGGWKGYEGISALILLCGLIYLIWSAYKAHYYRGFVVFIMSVMCMMFFTMLNIVPRIEVYSQNAAIEFIKTTQNKDVYVFSDGYKSFAPMFYGQTKCPMPTSDSIKNDMLKHGSDRDTYILLKSNRKEEYLIRYPELTILDEKNGYLFCIRRKK